LVDILVLYTVYGGWWLVAGGWVPPGRVWGSGFRRRSCYLIADTIQEAVPVPLVVGDYGWPGPNGPLWGLYSPYFGWWVKSLPPMVSRPSALVEFSHPQN
jgi:hypothetical protein